MRPRPKEAHRGRCEESPRSAPSTELAHCWRALTDLATDHFEEELDLALLENEEELLAEAKEALDHIEQGTLGRCESCHRRISNERLEALP